MRGRADDAAALSRRAAEALFPSRPGLYLSRLLLVADDVDPTDPADVAWAEATRCQPGAGEFLFHRYPTLPLVPYVGHGVPPAPGRCHAKQVRCCMLPAEFADAPLPWKVASFRGAYPQHVQDKVLRRWSEYGF
ncbi:hypothetical protein CDD83_100 [Cordyceps sp. RAO-2017]|nr:hypothetical protein CDD83_100 [Cordyceps sp. RAO-2017]